MTKAGTLRQMIRAPGLVRAVGAHNGLTARLVEEAGFEAVWASSFEVSASYALPDASLVTMTEHLSATEAMDAAVAIPVIADCDTGFGGPANVEHAVRGYGRRGIAAVCIEDKVFPKANSLADADHQLVPVEEFIAKITAGRAATRHGGGPLIVARTEALIAGHDLAEALRRGRAYARAGADAVLIHSKDPTPDRVLEFARAWDLDVPLVAVPTSYSQVGETDLEKAGFALVIYANQGLRAIVSGVRRTLRVLDAERRALAAEPGIASLEEIFALQHAATPGEGR